MNIGPTLKIVAPAAVTAAAAIVFGTLQSTTLNNPKLAKGLLEGANIGGSALIAYGLLASMVDPALARIVRTGPAIAMAGVGLLCATPVLANQAHWQSVSYPRTAPPVYYGEVGAK